MKDISNIARMITELGLRYSICGKKQIPVCKAPLVFIPGKASGVYQKFKKLVLKKCRQL